MFRLPYFFALVFLAACSSTAHLPTPYNQLKKVLPYDPSGWFYNHNQIRTMMREEKVKVVVIEVGSWLGRSTRHIARRVQEGGKVYAVDHWLGSSEHQVGEANYHEGLDHLYEQFLSNIIHKKLTDRVIPIRMASAEAAQFLSDVKPDMVYIDADHSTEGVYRDLTLWFPYVKGHGILCGDDWTWETVQVAIKRFAKEMGLVIESKHNFWRLKEPMSLSAM